MTHYEKLSQAKTKEDFAKEILEFITDFSYENGKISIIEWLDRERNLKETARRGVAMLIKGLFTGAGND